MSTFVYKTPHGIADVACGGKRKEERKGGREEKKKGLSTGI